MLKRILIAGLVIGLGLLVAAGVSMFLLYRSATATPPFYEEAVSEPASEEAAGDFEASVESLLPMVSAAPEDEPAEDAPLEPEFSGEDFETADAADADVPPTTTVTIRDRDLNSWLAVHARDVARQLGPELADPRFRFADGKITGGVRLNLPPYRGVLAGEIRPVMVDRDRFELHLIGLRVGTLDFPVSQLREDPAEATDDLGPGVLLKTDRPPPRLVLTWEQMADFPSRVVDFSIGEGELTVTLEPLPTREEPAPEEVPVPEPAL